MPRFPTLKKKERIKWREMINETDIHHSFFPEEMERALDKIDALEAKIRRLQAEARDPTYTGPHSR